MFGLLRWLLDWCDENWGIQSATTEKYKICDDLD